jgi:hypothetical protein
MGCILTHSPPTVLLGTHLSLPFYYILRKIPAYPFITAYPFMKFDEKVQSTSLLEPTLLLEM